MVHIDTDTVDDVRAIVADRVRRQANHIISSVFTHKRHPSMMTRAMLKDHAAQLAGMWAVYFDVMHWENIDPELSEKVNEAQRAVRELYGK